MNRWRYLACRFKMSHLVIEKQMRSKNFQYLFLFYPSQEKCFYSSYPPLP